MSVAFDSRQTQFKDPLGCVAVGNSVRLRIEIPKNYNPNRAWVVVEEFYTSRDFSVEMERLGENNGNVIFGCNIKFDNVNIHEYYFTFIDFHGTPKFIKRMSNLFEGTILENKTGQNWKLTVYKPVATHPNMKDGIMYQIFPDRFAKYGSVEKPPEDRIYRVWNGIPFHENGLIGRDFFGGNIKGINHRLKYLKSLGVSVLYLNPIWIARSNHRYDPGDYMVIDPLLGTIDELKRMIGHAHDLGMIVVLDTVLNHTGADSVFFNKYGSYTSIGAYNSLESPYHDWYYFEDFPDKYRSWWGFPEHPTINQSSESFQEYMFGTGGVIDYWYSLGFDGLRLDVPDELPNETLERIYECAERNGKLITIIGEVWEDASCKCNYGHRMEYFLGKELTSVMNYPVKNAVLAYIRYGENWANNLKETLITIFLENYPREIAFSLMNFLTSHDTVRAITKLAGVEADDHDINWQSQHDKLTREEYLLGKKRLEISYFLIYFLPGIPSIFYGDEIGISGQKDALCRKTFNWNRRDKKIVKFFKNLGKFRRSEKNFFKDADFNVVHIDGDICILERSKESRRLLLVVNRSDHVVDLRKYDVIPRESRIVFCTDKEKGNSYINSYAGIILEIL